MGDGHGLPWTRDPPPPPPRPFLCLSHVAGTSLTSTSQEPPLEYHVALGSYSPLLGLSFPLSRVGGPGERVCTNAGCVRYRKCL